MSPRAIYTTVLISSCLIVITGCHRNRAKTAPDLTVPVTTTEAAPAPEPEAPEPDVIEPDPLSAELGDLNQYLRRQGLLVDIYFDYDRSSLSFEARDQLAESARFLQERPQFTLTIEGHCDERGTNEY